MDITLYRHTSLFYTTSIAIPWALWFTVAFVSHHYPHQFVLFTSAGSFLGLLAPLLIALGLILPNKPLRNDIIDRLINLRKVKPIYLAYTFLLMPFSILVAQLISLLFGYNIEQFQYRDGFTFSSGIFPVWFMLIAAPLIEELAWHSYGTDCLRRKFSLLTTSLIFALIWGIWHLPLSFIRDYYHSNVAESGLLYIINFFVSLFPFVLIMNWLYYKSGRNILVAIILHILAGYFNELFMTHPMSKVIQTALLTLFSIYLIIHDKAFFTKN